MRQIQTDGQCHIEGGRSCVVAEKTQRERERETQGKLHRNMHSTVRQRKKPAHTSMKASLLYRQTNRFCARNFPNS